MSGHESDVEQAFIARRGNALKKENSKKESERARRKRVGKETKRKLESARIMNPDMGKVPPYCTMKTETVYDFFKAIGDLANGWKVESRNMAAINPGNPMVIKMGDSINKCANSLAVVLQQHIARVEADNVEMHNKQKAIDDARAVAEAKEVKNRNL